MSNIPPTSLKLYLETGLFKMYDLSPEAREEHDREAKWKREHPFGVCNRCGATLTKDEYEVDSGVLCNVCNGVVLG